MRGLLFLFLSICCFLPVRAQSVSQQIQQASDPSSYILENFDRIRSISPDTALYYLNELIRQAETDQNLLLAARAYEKRGITHFYLGKFEEERADLLTAMRKAEEAGDQGVMGNILKEMCLSANRQKDFPKSVSYGYRAISLCTAAGDQSCIASAQRNLGRTYLKLDKRDSADYFLRASYELKLAVRDSFGLPFALNDLAELAMYDGKVEEALDYLVQSADLREALQDSSGLAISLNNIGEIYLMNQQPEAAAPYFKRSLDLSGPLKFVDLQSHTLDQLGLAYRQAGNYEDAYTNLEQSIQLKDSLYSTDKAKAISELQIQYESEKKAQLIEQQRVRLRLQQLIGFSVLSIVLLIGSFVYYRIYQRRKYEQKIQALEVQQRLHNERERISRDLHDHVGANLTRIITDLDLIAEPGNKETMKAAPRKISETRSFTRQTIHLLRDTIWALNKEGYRCTELARKAEVFLTGYLEDRVEWKVEKELLTDPLLNSNEVLNLLRILQESTQNMLKHAQATRFEVSFSSTEQATSMRIKDNGIGTAIVREELDDHYGLYNMRQRAENIGAECIIQSAPDQGFEITVILPHQAET
ncbi:MAG: tetratricopeptide repeat protein [Bacteroidota bacterium]